MIEIKEMKENEKEEIKSADGSINIDSGYAREFLDSLKNLSHDELDELTEFDKNLKDQVLELYWRDERDSAKKASKEIVITAEEVMPHYEKITDPETGETKLIETNEPSYDGKVREITHSFKNAFVGFYNAVCGFDTNTKCAAAISMISVFNKSKATLYEGQMMHLADDKREEAVNNLLTNIFEECGLGTEEACVKAFQTGVMYDIYKKFPFLSKEYNAPNGYINPDGVGKVARLREQLALYSDREIHRGRGKDSEIERMKSLLKHTGLEGVIIRKEPVVDYSSEVVKTNRPFFTMQFDRKNCKVNKEEGTEFICDIVFVSPIVNASATSLEILSEETKVQKRKCKVVGGKFIYKLPYRTAYYPTFISRYAFLDFVRYAKPLLKNSGVNNNDLYIESEMFDIHNDGMSSITYTSDQ